MNTRTDFTLAIKSLRTAPAEQSTLDLVRVIVDRGDTSGLLEAVIAHGGARHSNEHDTISSVMQSLEALAESSQSVACILMANLWPIAAAQRSHDVCDAVDLWIADLRSSVDDWDLFARGVEQMMRSEPDSRNRRHFETWINRRAPDDGPGGAL